MAFKKKRGAGQKKGGSRTAPSRTLKSSSPKNPAKDEEISLSTTAVQPPRLGRLDASTSRGSERESALPSYRDAKSFFAADVAQGKFEGWDRMAGAHNKRISPVQRIAWGGGSLLLITLLAVQFRLFEGSRLAQNERLRPWLEAACQTLGCRLPPFRAPGRIQIVDHDLHPAPDGIDGYEFILVLSNRASLPQAFPAIKLILSGNNGAPAATRVFQPAEYLSGPSPGLMAVDKLQEIRLLLAKPQREVGGFSFELL